MTPLSSRSAQRCRRLRSQPGEQSLLFLESCLHLCTLIRSYVPVMLAMGLMGVCATVKCEGGKESRGDEQLRIKRWRGTLHMHELILTWQRVGGGFVGIGMTRKRSKIDEGSYVIQAYKGLDCHRCLFRPGELTRSGYSGTKQMDSEELQSKRTRPVILICLCKKIRVQHRQATQISREMDYGEQRVLIWNE